MFKRWKLPLAVVGIALTGSFIAAPTPRAVADPVILPSKKLSAGKSARLEVVAPSAAASCRIAAYTGSRWSRSHRVSLGGPTRFVRFRSSRGARGSFTVRFSCRGAQGENLGIVRSRVVVGRRAKPRGRLFRPGSVRVSSGSIPELTQAKAAQADPSSNNEVDATIGDGDPTKFTACPNSKWISSTRTIGDGIATYIQFVPQTRARGQTGPENSPVYGEMWSDLNRCAHFSPEITDDQRHSMYVQMACHAKWGISSWIGGNTWDLEAWRNDVEWSDGLSFGGRCGQRYGDVPTAASYLFGKLINTFPDPNPSHRAAYFVDNLDGIYIRRHVTTTKAYECKVAEGKAPARWYPLHFVETYLPVGPAIDDSICQSAGPTPTPGPAAPPPSTTRSVTVYNQVTNGGSAMREDKPAYLSAAARNFCKRDGCALANTDMTSGTRIVAYCQVQGDRTTNGWDGNADDDGNPNLYESSRWYGVRWADGRTGYLSEVWVVAGDRGGLGLTGC